VPIISSTILVRIPRCASRKVLVCLARARAMADATAVQGRGADGAPAAAPTSEKPAEPPIAQHDSQQRAAGPAGQAAAPAPDAQWVDPGA
jgi:hypothetical protein